MTELEFKRFNSDRTASLRALLEESEQASKLCDAWLATGHIADYRAWQTQIRHAQRADERDQAVRAGMLRP